MQEKLSFNPKQEYLISLFKNDKLKRINILQGSVRSGKTWISLILWAFWLATMPADGLYLMSAKNLTTLKRNCLLPLQELVGEDNFTFSMSLKEGRLFGRRVLLEGANDARAEGKIRGITLAGAYFDELTLCPEDFFTQLLARLSVKGAKLIATTNPDRPTHWLKEKYIDKAEDLDVLDLKFSFTDNPTLDKVYMESLKKEYQGVYYERFILGKWVVAEGAIYRIFSDDTQKYQISRDELPKLSYINIGVDFGGNGSSHAFVATGITGDFGKVIVLKSEKRKATGMTPNELYVKFYRFCESVLDSYGFIDHVYADSAEQTLINGMRTELKSLKLVVRNARKNPIVDRIRLTLSLMGSDRFYYIPSDCQTLEKALCDAVYDSKKLDDTRLDDGTSDIDTLDAYEYSVERWMSTLIKRGD